MKGKKEKSLLVRIDDAWVIRDDMDCLLNGDVQVNGAVISAYIQLMRHEEHLLHREGGDVYLENTFITQLLHRDGEPPATTWNYSRNDMVETWVQNYLKADMVFLPINIVKFHWYVAIVNASIGEIHVLDSFGDQMSNFQDLEYTLIGMERMIKHVAEHIQLDRQKWKHGIEVSSWPTKHMITKRAQTDGVSCGLWMLNYMEYWTGTTLSGAMT
ncbi:putative ubiquitin-like-specific protease 1B [Miscanthus floridulus]|uniref:putative ubiquitin-like-specific protease 1B n=1 Tax=Miscanthus floridulus TaxID=154761 RepID=UPI00345B34EB